MSIFCVVLILALGVKKDLLSLKLLLCRSSIQPVRRRFLVLAFSRMEMTLTIVLWICLGILQIFVTGHGV